MNFIIRTDGASRGNPGPAAAAFVIASQDGVIWAQDAHFIGQNTNNVAEYTAVKMALQRLIKDFGKHLPTEVEIISDSLLIVSQLAGRYKIKNEILKSLHAEIKSLEHQAGTVRYTHALRHHNFIADKLANQALDAEAERR